MLWLKGSVFEGAFLLRVCFGGCPVLVVKRVCIFVGGYKGLFLRVQFFWWLKVSVLEGALFWWFKGYVLEGDPIFWRL